MKYMILIYGNPENWGHPTFLRTPEALTMPEQQRDQLMTQFVQLMEECSRIAEVVHRRIPHGIEITAREGAALPAAR